MNSTVSPTRQKLEAEIDLLDEHQLEDLYKVIHYYRLGAQTGSATKTIIQSSEFQKRLNQVLARMKRYTIADNAPRLSREELHERR
jgi:hypothetical protein